MSHHQPSETCLGQTTNTPELFAAATKEGGMQTPVLHHPCLPTANSTRTDWGSRVVEHHNAPMPRNCLLLGKRMVECKLHHPCLPTANSTRFCSVDSIAHAQTQRQFWYLFGSKKVHQHDADVLCNQLQMPVNRELMG